MLFEMEELIAYQRNLINRADALVCSQCFRFVGSIEQQLRHRLLGDTVNSSAGASDGRSFCACALLSMP